MSRALAVAILVLLVAPARAEEVTDRMQRMFDALRTVFVLSADDDAIASLGNQQSIDDALSVIVRESAGLAAHTAGVSSVFELLSEGLAAEASGIREGFDEGNAFSVRRSARKLTAYCGACHSRLPEKNGSYLGRALLADPRVETLAPSSRMQLAVATRDFELASDLGEDFLRSPSLSPEALDATGIIAQYLLVSLRVQHDPARSLKTLVEFRAREDMPAYLARYLDAWIEDLAGSHLGQRDEHPVERARQLIDEGQDSNRYPTDRMGLIHFVQASRILHRFVEAAGDAEVRLAEAYQLLGVAELHSVGSLWPAELYLETAIRLAPGTKAAQRAYLTLEEEITARYIASTGARVPVTARSHLDTLAKLAGVQ